MNLIIRLHDDQVAISAAMRRAEIADCAILPAMVYITDHSLLPFASADANDRLLRLQEQLYRQINLLLPDASASHDWFVSRINQLPALRLQILERHKYSTFLRLTCDLQDGAVMTSEPEAHIRSYHDLRVAELTAFNQTQGINRIAGPDMRAARLHQIHWRQNRSLSKWLDFLLGQGHSAATMAATTAHDNAMAQPGKQKQRVKQA